MSKLTALKGLISLTSATLVAATAQAQDAKAILDALVQKGVLTSQEASQIAADAKAPVVAIPGSRNVSRLAINGRIQTQFNYVEGNAEGATDPVSSADFVMRRVLLGATADFGSDFRGVFSYDFAAGSFDAAFVRWNQSKDLSVDFGLSKVNMGIEENTSSGRLPAIERSPVTRYFVENPSNNSRLGAGSYHVGVFANGKSGGFFYGAAITNPERSDISATVVNNQLAYWANLGYSGKTESVSYTLGASFGLIPEFTGNGASLFISSYYGTLTAGAFGLTGEFLWSDYELGNGSNGWGVNVIPTFDLNKNLQLAARFSYLDTDGRGALPSTVVPRAQNVGNTVRFDQVTEVYGGINYFFKGHDVKLSAGLFWADFNDRVSASGATGVSYTGLRSQMQVNF
jgi:hypothetical protein